MKKILIFSLAYFPHVGGAEVTLKEITDRISPEDIEFHLITLRFLREDAPTEKMGNVTVHRVGGGTGYLSKVFFIVQAALAVRKLDKTHHFDGSWAMMGYMVFPIVLARLNMPYLLTLQEGDPFEHVFGRWFIRPFLPLLSYGFKHATEVQTISTYLLTWAKQMGFKGEGVVIPNGVHAKYFAHEYSREEIEAKQKDLGKKEGDVFLVTTSRLVRKNAVDDVIRALTFLPENVHFIIYGIGKDEISLRTLAKERGVEERAHFLGQISHEDMPLALKACDIFIRSSRSEGMGNSFVEAMAAGLPVIATQEGGIADFLFDAKRNPDRETTGWAVDKDSPKQIAEAVMNIIASPEQVRRVVATARKMAFEKYDWDFVAGKMRRLFDQMCAGV